jgi:hypothetical protein
MKPKPFSLLFAVLLCQANTGGKKDVPTEKMNNNLFSTI